MCSMAASTLLRCFRLSPIKALFFYRVLFHFSSISRPKPSWNSNQNLVVTHPILSCMECCDSMAELRQIQAQLTRTGLIIHRFPASRVLAFCALSDNGDMNHARLLFDRIPDPNTYIWNTMIRGYIRWGYPRVGLSFFCDMNAKKFNFDCRTFVFVLKACEYLSDFLLGQTIHGLAYKWGINFEMLVQNGLMHYYIKMGQLDSVRKVFDGMAERDVVSWTTIIDGYSENGHYTDALRTFQCMLTIGVQLNAVTMITMLSVCSQTGFLNLGRSFHGYVEKSFLGENLNLMNALVDMYGKCGCLDSARRIFDWLDIKDVFSWTSMMSGYAKCGDLEHARKLFDKMPEKNVVSWSSIIAGYAQANQSEEALNCFREMLLANVEPITATLVNVLSACGRCGYLDLGRWIYEHYIEKKGLKLSVNLSNAFIDMYAKCGAINLAAKMFHEMTERDIVSWNSIIMGYGFHGHGSKAVTLFEQLKREGVVPDDITFVGVLSACGHAGLVSEGRRYFFDMKAEFGIEPKPVHYACMVDLLGRVGLLDDAYELVRNMPIELDEAGWGALLNACKVHGNLKLGHYAGEKLLGVDPGDSGVYTLLSNMYATWNKWDEVKQLRVMMRDRKVKKVPGLSSIEIEGKSHGFFVADRSHVCSERIYAILNMIYMHSSEKGTNCF
ncbi:pentatricopeptide repeat-containing protein At2g22410, mitochondrial [Dendrobium catenatum]|uniref:Pentatricopeptide repeat-containing protein n=1 Tax=Dendrobium catenatum TaxID=906689 RepID=A0A2I0WCX6_9ASPA|nr:pentatricopeptide repeat-containing protein At2g22410, mitochondrial [Dendrobium catenatum]XP_028553192.1 pentatricopeptide repeat-containing protein At2g22410, mitochondrial [Dendrobium catenatum]PKU73508.1 Pentatricopeptide repeat-containing protein [Dendrobium catenatum]